MFCDFCFLFTMDFEFVGAFLGLPGPSRIDPDRFSMIFVHSRPVSSTFYSFSKNTSNHNSVCLFYLQTNFALGLPPRPPHAKVETRILITRHFFQRKRQKIDASMLTTPARDPKQRFLGMTPARDPKQGYIGINNDICVCF